MDNINPNMQELINRAKNGQVEDLLSKLKPEESAKLQEILSDKEATNRLLATPQAQQLLKLFVKGGK